MELCLTATPSAAAPTWGRTSTEPVPEFSASFLPFRFNPEDTLQVRLFRLLASRLPQDSTRHWSYSHGRIEISHDLLFDLTGGGDSLMWDRGPLQAFTDFLNGRFRLKLRPARAAFGRFVPNDSFYRLGPQWGLSNPGGVTPLNQPETMGLDVDVEKVWDRFSGADSLVVAVVDAGFDFKHPDLAGRHWINAKEARGLPGVDDDGNGFIDDSIGWDFVEKDANPDDYHGHGTKVSSVIASGFDNGRGLAGILAQGKIMPVRVLDASGHGDEDDIAAGITYAVNNGAKAINLSIGGGGDNAALKKAFLLAHDKAVPIIAAAGNDALNLDKTPVFPALYDYDNLIIVAAHSAVGQLSPFSNYGATKVQLAAPGEDILIANTPARKPAWTEGFESGLGNWTVTGMALSPDKPLAGSQSLVWTAGNNAQAATAGYLDLTGIRGSSLSLRLEYKPASSTDFLILEGNREGSAQWVEIGVFGGVVAGDVAMGLQGFDGSKFKLRIRTSLSSLRSSAGRVVKIDALTITYPDPNPPTQEIYDVTGGTSVAAPFVTAYVALQRLACDRMGITWTRGLALEGVTPDSNLTGKVSTGGRLDIYKGLEFYLKTLPSLRLRDSTARMPLPGETAQFLIDVFPAPAQPYHVAVSGLGDAAKFDSAAGQLAWTPQKPGTYVLTLTAEGPTVLRKRLVLTVESGTVPTRVDRLDGHALRVGARKYRLPDIPNGHKRLLSIVGSDALGRTQILKQAWVGGGEDAVTFRAAPDRGLAFTHIRVLLDGQDLPESR